MGWWGLKWVHDQTQSLRLGRFHLDADKIKDLLGRTRQGRHGQQVVAMPNAS
jgi:hypothetical protein